MIVNRIQRCKRLKDELFDLESRKEQSSSQKEKDHINNLIKRKKDEYEELRCGMLDNEDYDQIN